MSYALFDLFLHNLSNFLLLFRQFQSRLLRSKLAMARIMGNKALEKELRSKNLGGLHTDVVAEEDYAFLAKLEHRPCTATHYTPPYREISREREKRQVSREQEIETLPTSNHSQSSSSARLRSAPGHLLRSLTTIGLPKEDHNKKIGESRTDAKLVCSKRSSVQQTILKGSTKGQTKENKNTISYASDTIKTKQRPKTVTIVTRNPDTTPLPSPRQYSRRTSRAADFFEEDKKIDLVELRLKAARALDYTDKVQEFCGELEEMASGQPQADWYSMRLHSQEPVKKDLGLSDIKEDGDSRDVGNLNVRSMTLPQLDLSFN